MNAPMKSDQAQDKVEKLDFTLPYQTLKDVYNKYISNVFTTIGTVVLAIGWIVNSDASRKFLQDSSLAYYLSLTAVLLIWIIHVIVLLGAYRASVRLTNLLSSQYHIGADYIFYYMITKVKVGGSIALDTILFSILFGLIYSLKWTNVH